MMGDQEVIPAHILNLMCAVHLRQEHGYKGWTIVQFKEHFPGLRTENGGFDFAALHVLHHTQVGSFTLNEQGIEVAYVSIDPEAADHLKH